MANSLVSRQFPAPSEESSWTSYVQDFETTQQGMEEGGSCFSIHGGSSMEVSDAASWIACNPSRNSKKLIFRRRKARGAMDDVDEDDEALEDTATSPANSPKISFLNHLEISARKEENARQNSQNGVGYMDSAEFMKRSKMPRREDDTVENLEIGLFIDDNVVNDDIEEDVDAIEGDVDASPLPTSKSGVVDKNKGTKRQRISKCW
ncbi:vascular-related unknown protein 1-like isoform X2 [Canna indica]|uniref:Uncharacterized protein n=1 Tax=Canna indica TaxID=4628 RepID=A0AAQ3K985_9LILI|nr:vascular-related unknown protein 1-like isoform X2 [Canna indica]